MISALIIACGKGGRISPENTNLTVPHGAVLAKTQAALPDQCPNGGAKIDSGIDTNANGVLDPKEVSGTQYVCNGENGALGQSGINTLVKLTNLDAGSICANGGTMVQAGLDTNRDGVLANSEIFNTRYICNGTNGTNGSNGAAGKNALVITSAEASGSVNCPNGGSKIQAGLDSNNNNALDESEVTSTRYVCNGAAGATGSAGATGAAGKNTVLNSTEESAGEHCPVGGTKIQTGLDGNNNNALDDSEITSTRYVCNGAVGAAGVTGSAGATGAAGKNALVTITEETAGSDKPCAVNGGVRIATGLDRNGNGVLDESSDEVTGNRYICNGATGATGATGLAGAAGKNALVRMSVEAAGSHCATGGTKVEAGLDTNGDSTLADGEVTQTGYACNGATGLTGAAGKNTLVKQTEETTGPNCSAGGTRFEVGLDSNNNNTLDESEVTSTRYVCNGAAGATGSAGVTGATGAAGKSALVKTSAETAGLNCPNAGSKIEVGLDANGNTTLDSDEVSSTRYVCNGTNGTNGATGTAGKNTLVSITAESVGDNCAAGASKIQAGLDTDGSGTLSDGEVTQTRYVCNGVNGTNGAAGAAGANGKNALAILTPESPGSSCANGGTRIEVGVDSDGSGTLTGAEIANTRYVCNGSTGSKGDKGDTGAIGSKGLATLILMTELSSGNTSCPYGGQKVESGVDNNANDTLDSSEVLKTAYLCNGRPASGGAITQVITSNQTLTANQIYQAKADTQLALTLPPTANLAVGDEVTVTGVGGGGWRLILQTGQSVVGLTGISQTNTQGSGTAISTIEATSGALVGTQYQSLTLQYIGDGKFTPTRFAGAINVFNGRIGGQIPNNTLTSSGLVLQNNGANDLSVPLNASSFTFTAPVAYGASYNVTIKTQPTGLLCSIANGSGSATSNTTAPTLVCDYPAWDKDNEVALLIETGQNNATAFGTTMSTALAAGSMPNVKGLARSNNFSFTMGNVTWSPYEFTATATTGASLFDLGRGDTGTDAGNANGSMKKGTTSIATEFARSWQAHITAGNAKGLPDLYIVRVTWPGNGIGQSNNSYNHWRVTGVNPTTTDINKAPYFTKYVLQKTIANLKAMGKKVRIIGNLWLQGEFDSASILDANDYYNEAAKLFGLFDAAVGVPIPTTFVKLRNNDTSTCPYPGPVNAAFDRFITDRGRGNWLLDPYSYSGTQQQPYLKKTAQGSLYISDGVNFTLNAINEFAQMYFNRVVTSGYAGPYVTPSSSTAAPFASAAVSNVGTDSPEYYYVVALAGQSNMVGYGEVLPDPLGLDAPHPRVKQVGRAAGQDKTIVPATHSLDHVQHMVGSARSNTANHAKVKDSTYAWPLYGGTVGTGQSIGKKLLPYLPPNVGILLVPAARGLSDFTTGTDNAYTVGSTKPYVDGINGTGSNGTWTKWGVSGGVAGNEGGKTGLYLDMRERIKWALDQNPKNVFMGVIWMQGESDLNNAALHKTMFEEQVKTLGTDLNLTHSARCLRSNCSKTPWVTGDTSIFWLNNNAAGYNSVYLNNYGVSSLPNVSFVPFMYMADGNTTTTNADSPYNASTNPTGADGRTFITPASHFSSDAQRGVVAQKLADQLRQATYKTTQSP